MQWNWFSDVTAAAAVTCIQWRQRTNFTAPDCTCRCPIINLQYAFAPSPPSTPFCFSCPLVLVLLSYHLAFTEAERRVSLRFVSRSVQNDMHLWETVNRCASTPHPRDFLTATTFTAILTGTYLRTGAFDRRTLTHACAGFVCTIRGAASRCASSSWRLIFLVPGVPRCAALFVEEISSDEIRSLRPGWNEISHTRTWTLATASLQPNCKEG